MITRWGREGLSTTARRKKNALPNEVAPDESRPLRYVVVEGGITHPSAYAEGHQIGKTSEVSGPCMFGRELLELGNSPLPGKGEPSNRLNYHDERVDENVFARVYQSISKDDVKETLRRQMAVVEALERDESANDDWCA